ncbi:MAG: hypothetical protein RLZZ292_3992, partial [Bacteroidota bacterium]
MVIDTSIFIEHLRASDKSKTTLALLPLATNLYVSSVTTYELYNGANTMSKQQDVKILLSPLTTLVFNDNVALEASKIFQYLRQNNLLIDHR